MSEENSSLAYALRVAAEAEKEAVEFYRGAAQKANKDVLQRLFNGLADLEQIHYDRVVEMTLSMQKKGKLLFYDGCSLVIPAQSEIDFSQEAGEALAAAKLSLMDVLTAAQNVEKQIGKRYSDLAEQTDNPDGKAMFELLAKEEARHLTLLTKVYWNLNDRGVLAWPRM